MDTKKNLFLKNKFWAIILVAQFSLFYILSKIDAAVDLFNTLFETKKAVHILLFSRTGFSAGDVIYILVSLYLILMIVYLIKRKKGTVRQVMIFINTVYFIYQCFWGMLYFQKPIIAKLQKKEITEDDLKNLTIKYLKLCAESREKVSEDKAGIFVIDDLEKIEKEILEQQKMLPASITTKKPVTVISVKQSVFDRAMSFTGILGYYNPFTAEAQYNAHLPHTQLPFTLAHEMSHQLGFAREQEASFIAYLCAKNSANPDLQYSAQLYVLKSLLRSLSSKDTLFVKKILSQFSYKMKRDRASELQFFMKHDGLVSDIFGITNDLFLKSNQQDGSITYSYFVTLLALYEA